LLFFKKIRVVIRQTPSNQAFINLPLASLHARRVVDLFFVLCWNVKWLWINGLRWLFIIKVAC